MWKRQGDGGGGFGEDGRVCGIGGKKGGGMRCEEGGTIRERKGDKGKRWRRKGVEGGYSGRDGRESGRKNKVEEEAEDDVGKVEVYVEGEERKGRKRNIFWRWRSVWK